MTAQLNDKLAAATGKATITTPAEREIRVERVFNAPRESVWKALTDPTLIAEWWGPGGSKVVVERMELKKGGHWRFVEHRANGTDGFEGRFREVTAPERLVQSFEWDGMPAHVAIQAMTLDDLGGGRTRLVTVMQMHTPEERDGFLHSGMEGGLNLAYAQLDALLATSSQSPS